MANGKDIFEKLSKLAANYRPSGMQPRWAMGMAMTLFSFAMLKQLPPADFNPIRIWRGTQDKVIRVKDRAVEHYENIRLVCRLERQLKDLQRRQREITPRPDSRLN